MSLEYIYIARHGFRSNWVVNPTTGDYKAFVRSPTGNPADPALTSHGVDQSRELAAYLAGRSTMTRGGDENDSKGIRTLPFPVERVYCSPYYRCLQTIQPFVEAARNATGEAEATLATATGPDGGAKPWWAARCDGGLVDWFGPAPFEQPQPAAVQLLHDKFFPWIDLGYRTSGIVPRVCGESMAQLHARMAATLTHIVRQCDAEGVRAIVICSHAAPIIAMGRALTGNVPEDVEMEDFGAFTCGLSVFHRRRTAAAAGVSGTSGTTTTAATAQQPSHQESPSQGPSHRQWHSQHQYPQALTSSRARHVLPWDDPFHTLAGETWTNGQGVGGGWDCEVNCDCSFLSEGEERGWRFSGDDESFARVERHNSRIVDAGISLGVVVEGRSAVRAMAGSKSLHEIGDGGGCGDDDFGNKNINRSSSNSSSKSNTGGGKNPSSRL